MNKRRLVVHRQIIRCLDTIDIAAVAPDLAARPPKSGGYSCGVCKLPTRACTR